MWSRPIPSPWHTYKQDMMKLNLQTVSFAADAMKMLNGARLSVNGLYSITGVDWLTAAGINFSTTTALRLTDLEGLPSNNTMGPVKARPLPDVKLNLVVNLYEGTNRTTRKNVQADKSTPRSRKRKSVPETSKPEDDVQRYGGLKAIKKDETIFAAYDKAEMRKAKSMVVVSSDFVYTSKSLFLPDVIMLAAVDLELMQSLSMAIGVQRQVEMNPITIIFAGMETIYTVGVS